MLAKHWALYGALSWVVAMAIVGALVLHMNERAADFRSMSLRGTATLVGYTESDDRDRRNRATIRRFEVYEFEPAQGQRVRFSSPILANDAPRALGQTVAIRYPAMTPQAARLEDDGLARTTRLMLWIVPIGLLFAVPFLVVWFTRRQRSVR